MVSPEPWKSIAPPSTIVVSCPGLSIDEVGGVLGGGTTVISLVAGADDPKVPEHVGFIPTATVEDAIAEAERIHGRDCSIVCVEQAMG